MAYVLHERWQITCHPGCKPVCLFSDETLTNIRWFSEVRLRRVVMFVAAGQPERCVQPSGLGRICSRNSRARYAPLKADPAMKVAWLVA
ncbi:hypothetical protein D6D08_07803 [Aureobasidium pullulans]|nr:hypothetical protein D6D08_07803 [Aureobasidium pullulans]